MLRFILVCTAALALTGFTEHDHPEAGWRNGCGDTDKILAGCAATSENWPGMVAFRLHNASKKTSVYFCGGTVIAPEWVLTAAHCFRDGTSATFRRQSDRYTAFLTDRTFGLRSIGSSRMKEELKGRPPLEGEGFLQAMIGVADLTRSSTERTRTVTQIILHEKYNGDAKSGFDIALVRLDAPWLGASMRLSAAISRDPPSYPWPVMVAGYGVQDDKLLKIWPASELQAEYFAAGSRHLFEVKLDPVKAEECREAYSQALIGTQMICAGFKTGVYDSCHGDSGGPLVGYDEQKLPYQIGIVSWGRDCGKPRQYGVYVRVSDFVDWIQSKVQSVSWLK